MFSKKYSSVVLVLIISLVFYLLHKTVIYFLGLSEVFSEFNTPLELLYFVFGLISALITFALLIVKEKDYNQVGMTFLGMITLKMIVVYFIFKPRIPNVIEGINYEKINFIILFILFLIIETIVTAKILNSKNK